MPGMSQRAASEYRLGQPKVSPMVVCQRAGQQPSSCSTRQCLAEGLGPTYITVRAETRRLVC